MSDLLSSSANPSTAPIAVRRRTPITLPKNTASDVPQSTDHDTSDPLTPVDLYPMEPAALPTPPSTPSSLPPSPVPSPDTDVFVADTSNGVIIEGALNALDSQLQALRLTSQTQTPVSTPSDTAPSTGNLQAKHKAAAHIIQTQQEQVLTPVRSLAKLKLSSTQKALDSLFDHPAPAVRPSGAPIAVRRAHHNPPLVPLTTVRKPAPATVPLHHSQPQSALLHTEQVPPKSAPIATIAPKAVPTDTSTPASAYQPPTTPIETFYKVDAREQAGLPPLPSTSLEEVKNEFDPHTFVGPLPRILEPDTAPIRRFKSAKPSVTIVSTDGTVLAQPHSAQLLREQESTDPLTPTYLNKRSKVRSEPQKHKGFSLPNFGALGRGLLGGYLHHVQKHMVAPVRFLGKNIFKPIFALSHIAAPLIMSFLFVNHNLQAYSFVMSGSTPIILAKLFWLWMVCTFVWTAGFIIVQRIVSIASSDADNFQRIGEGFFSPMDWNDKKRPPRE